MIRVNEDSSKWAKKYNLDESPLECQECKTLVRLTQPIALKGYRGLTANVCSNCGVEFKPFRVTPVGKEKEDFWKNILESVEETL